jgi:hypothetical protein
MTSIPGKRDGTFEGIRLLCENLLSLVDATIIRLVAR